MKRIKIEIDENERGPGYRDYLREEFERVLDKVLGPGTQLQPTSAIEKSLPKLSAILTKRTLKVSSSLSG